MDRRVTTIAYFILVYTLFCAVALEKNTIELSANDIDTDCLQNSESDPPPKKWISQLFKQAEMAFEMNSNVNAECKRDFNTYKLHLRNQSVWTVKMMESSEWPSVGIFSGMVFHFGNYDECLAISSYDIKGQYCLAEATYDYPDTFQNELMEEVDERMSVWEAISMYQKNPAKVNRRKLSFAMCIPSSCKSTDLKISLNSTLFPMFENHGLHITVDVNPAFCKVHSENNYTRGFFFVTFFFVALFSLVIFSTCYDTSLNMTRHDEIKSNHCTSISKRLFESCSLVRNFRNLKNVDSKTDYPGIHFTKVLHILIVVYGHRFMCFNSFPTFNTEVAEKYYITGLFELVHLTIVDGFFILSGFLTFHFGLLPMMKGGKFFLLFNILSRWMRMVPVFGILVLYIIYIFPYTNDGPLWDHKIMNEISKCKETWWTTLLAISNIVKTDQQCLVISWYISVDIQLAIIGGILLYIYSKNRKIGIFATAFSYILFAAITFTVAYKNQYSGVLRIYPRSLEDLRNDKEFSDFYGAIYTRGGPYLVGTMSAIAADLLKDKKIRLANKQIYLISLLSVLVSEGCQFYGFRFYSFNRQHHRLEGALYASIHRSLFVFTHAVNIVLHLTTGLGIFNKFLEWEVWVPIGRLTYSVFLLNTVIQLYYTSSQKQLLPQASRMNWIWWTSGDVICCYIIGFLLHLFVEAPITNLSKIMKRQLMNTFVKPKPDECLEPIQMSKPKSDKHVCEAKNGIELKPKNQ